MTDPYATLDDAPSCEYCVVLSGIDTSHWPITHLTRREKRKLHAAWHGNDSAGVRSIITAAMARGNYSWLANQGCEVKNTLTPQAGEWKRTPSGVGISLIADRVSSLFFPYGLAAILAAILSVVTVSQIVQTLPLPQKPRLGQDPKPAVQNNTARRGDDGIFSHNMLEAYRDADEPLPQTGATDYRNWIANSSAVIACQMQPALCDIFMRQHEFARFIARHDGPMRDCIVGMLDDTDIDTAIEECLKEDTP